MDFLSMKLLLLFLVFILLSIAASKNQNHAPMFKRFCSEGCTYLKSIDKNPKAKIDFKKFTEKCKTDPKAPKFLCKVLPDQNTIKEMEKHTWAEMCKAACGK